MSSRAKKQPDPNYVLCKALFRAKEDLNLNQAQIGKTIGLDRTSIGRLENRELLPPDSKTGELALLLIRAYRALYAMLGGDKAAMQHWINTPNLHLGGAPVELISSIQGLIHVVEYLDAIRGKV